MNLTAVLSVLGWQAWTMHPPGKVSPLFLLKGREVNQKTQFLKLWVDVCVDVFCNVGTPVFRKKNASTSNETLRERDELRVDGWILLNFGGT